MIQKNVWQAMTVKHVQHDLLLLPGSEIFMVFVVVEIFSSSLL